MSSCHTISPRGFLAAGDGTLHRSLLFAFLGAPRQILADAHQNLVHGFRRPDAFFFGRRAFPGTPVVENATPLAFLDEFVQGHGIVVVLVLVTVTAAAVQRPTCSQSRAGTGRRRPRRERRRAVPPVPCVPRWFWSGIGPWVICK